MKRIESGYKFRINVIVRELTDKLKDQGYLTKSDTKFLNLAKAMTNV